MAINHKMYGNVVIKGNLYLTGILEVTSSTYLASLTTSGGAVAVTPDGAVAGSTRKKVKISIDSVDYYLLAANDWIDAGAESTSPSASVSPSSSRSPSASASASLSPSASASSSASASISPSASVSPSASISPSASASPSS